MLDTNQHLEVYFFMTKFSKETRIDVVMAIVQGTSIGGAARNFGVGKNEARKWYRAYQSGGIDQLQNTRQHYSREFKILAIEYRWQNGLSYPQAASALGIPAGCTLYFWEKIYLEQGADGLLDTRRGRSPNVDKSRKPKKPQEPMTREQQLEVENARLRMENDYLKKLNALVAEREKSAKKTK
jgi:transposase